MIWLLPIINLVAVLATTVTTIYWLLVQRNIRKSKLLMPVVAKPEYELPIIGHALTLYTLCKSSSELWSFLSRTLEYYEDGCCVNLGHQLWLFSSDLQVIEEILSSPDAVEKSYAYRTLSTFTEGVFIASGARWRKLRKRLNLTFNSKMLDSYMDAVNNNVEIFTNMVIRNLIQKNNRVDNIQPHLALCFFDIMTSTHFGARTDEQIQDQYHAPETVSKIVETIIEERVMKPYLHPDFIFQFTDTYKFLDELKKKPLSFVNSFIEERMNFVDNAIANGQFNTNEEDSLLYVDLIAKTLKEENIPVTSENIQRHSADIIIAGTDTASITTALVLYHLALDKDIQEKVYVEVSRLFGNNSLRPLNRQELASLTYLEMVVNEALRWSAPHGIMREIRKDLDVGKYVIPKDTSIYLMMSSQHMNKKFYERADEFYPEHFTSEAIKSRPKMAFFPFSYGPRNCPGKQFGYVMVKTMAASIVNNYILETDLPFKDVKRKMILLTQHVQGYPVRFIPRNHNSPRESTETTPSN